MILVLVTPSPNWNPFFFLKLRQKHLYKPAFFSLSFSFIPSPPRLMRLTLFLPTLALLSVVPLLVSSHAFPHRRDRSHPSSIIASRQYRFPRDLLDVCINVNANLLADASQLLGLSSLLGALNLGADIELCLCLKVSVLLFNVVHLVSNSSLQDLDLYLETNDAIQALVGLLGKNTVGALITALVRCYMRDFSFYVSSLSR